MKHEITTSSKGETLKTRERADHSIITCFVGCVTDQSELTGMLNGLAELHLPLLTVVKIDE